MYLADFWKQELTEQLTKRGGDWRSVQGYCVQVVRNDADQDLGDVVSILVTLLPAQLRFGVGSNPCLAEFRASDIMANLSGSEYAKLIQSVLDWHCVPYDKFMEVAISRSVFANDAKLRRDLLQTLKRNVGPQVELKRDIPIRPGGTDHLSTTFAVEEINKAVLAMMADYMT